MSGKVKDVRDSTPERKRRMSEPTSPLSGPLLHLVEAFKWLALIVSALVASLYRNCVPYNLQKKKSLNGKTVLITGAGGGIGRELATQLCEHHVRLVLWDREAASNDETAQICQKLGAKVFCQTVDITDRRAVYRAAEQLQLEFGAPDILVNNAGVLNPTSFLETDDEKMDKLVDVNVKSLFWVTKAFLPAMLANGEGHVVGVASVAALFGAPQLVDYSTSKFAAYGFMESLRHQVWTLQPAARLAFTTVCPFYCRTPMIDNLSIADRRFPFLTPDYVARRTIEAIRIEQKLLIMPRLQALFFAFRQILPCEIAQSMVMGRRCFR